jgi:hypothetical protein
MRYEVNWRKCRPNSGHGFMLTSATEAVFRNQFGGLTFQIKFTFHNTGHLPAMYVFTDPGRLSFWRRRARWAPHWSPNRQKRRCQSRLQQPGAVDQLGTTVFPGQTPSTEIGFGIDQGKIDFVNRLEVEKTGTAMQIITPWGVGCIRYRSPDGALNQTGFAFIVNRTEPGREGTFALPSDPTNVPASQLAISPWIEGGLWYAY